MVPRNTDTLPATIGDELDTSNSGRLQPVVRTMRSLLGSKNSLFVAIEEQWNYISMLELSLRDPVPYHKQIIAVIA